MFDSFDAKPIVKRLKSYRKEHDIKQGDLAKRIGVSGPTLSQWENERTSFNPTLKQLLSIADMFRVSLTELLSQKEATKRTGKIEKNKPADKTPTKAVSSKSFKVKSEDASKEKAKASKRTVEASAAATVSKDAKTNKTSKAKEAAKRGSKTPAKKAAKASTANTGAAPEKKPGRSRKVAK